MINFSGVKNIDTDRINKQYFRFDKQAYFDITPRIVPVGEKVEIKISSKDKCRKIAGTYLVMINPLYDFDYVPFEVYKDSIMEVEVHDEVLSFEYLFPKEQQYNVIVGENTENGISILLKTSFYALNLDLYGQKILVGDLHSHTIYSDGFDTPQSVVDSAVRHKLDFIAVTDHNNYQGSVAAKEYAEANKIPITVINGEEYSCSFTNMHIISLGGKRPLKWEDYQPYPCEKRKRTLQTVLEYTEELCGKIHKNDGVAIMCHPLWKPFRPDGTRLDVPMSLVKTLIEKEFFDAIEVVGGSPEEDYMTSQMQFTWAVGFGATPDKVAYVGSTDSHTYTVDPICGKHVTMIIAKEKTQSAIIDSIKNRHTVALKIIDEDTVLCYGSPRLCMLAQFYIMNLFRKIK